MKSPELSVTPEKIDKLINRVNSGDIRIPAFQRGFVWKPNQIIELLDSVVKNYPIGSVLLWNTNDRLNHTRNIAGYKIPVTKDDYPVNYVLDGQQRISSIYAVFSDKTEQEDSTEKYNPNLDIFEIVYDFSKKIFVHKNDVTSASDCVIYLRNFLDGAKLITALSSLNTIYHGNATELYSKLINYELPVVTIKNRAKAEVGIIFERINNTGTKLSIMDLMIAWTWTDNFHLSEKMEELLEELEEKNFGELSQNILLQTISGIIQNDTTTSKILELSGEQVRDNWEKVCEALRKAIDFLHTELNCSIQDFLPFQQQIAPIAKFYSEGVVSDAEQIKSLKKWFWKTSFSDRYSTGQTTSKMNTDIETIIQIREGNYKAVDSIKYSVTESELIGTKFSKANPLTRAFLLLMAQYSPIDLVKNTKIDITQALSEYNRKQFHHIFPNAFLKTQGVEQKKIFSIVNFCFLPADSNKNISKKKPSDYFFNLIPQSDFNTILESNLIPIKKDIYQRNDYTTFIEKRAEIIVNEVDKITN
ncbi:MAG: DUF262 domain-containing protein [Bacteroidales bacterium]